MKSSFKQASLFFLPVMAFLAIMAWAATSHAVTYTITPTDITADVPYEQYNSDVCRDSAGNLHLVYEDNTQVWYRKKTGNTWSNAIQIGIGTQPAVAVGPDNLPAFVFINKSGTTEVDRLYYRKHAGFHPTTGGSMGWFGTTIGAGTCTDPDIAVDANNKAHVVCKGTWYYGDGYSDIYYFNNVSAGFSVSSTPIWGANGTFEYGLGNYFEGPAFVALDSSGNYYIAYQYRNYMAPDWYAYLQIYRSVDGSTFSKEGAYRTWWPTLERNCLAVDTNGDQHLVFGSNYALISKINGTPWTTVNFGYGDAAVDVRPGDVVPHVVATDGSTLYHMTVSGTGEVGVDLSLGVSTGRNPSVVAGANNAEIIFEQIPSGGSNHDVYYLKTGPIISASPASHDFGQVPTGTTAGPQTITLSNAGTENLTISSIAPCENTDFSLGGVPALPLTLMPGQTQDIEVSFSPTATGEAGCNLEITSNDPETPGFSIPLAGFGGQIYTLTIGMTGTEYGYVEVYDGESWIPPNVDGTFDIIEGATPTITAWPYTCETFTGWTGDLTSTDNPLVIGPVDADVSITANFGPTASSLTTDVNAPAMGSVSPGGTYDCGTDVEITATPADSCHVFTGWSGDAEGTENPLVVTVNGTMNITANFQVIQYDLFAENGDPGMGSVTGSWTYDCGDTAQVEAVPVDSCHYFIGWSGPDASGSNNPLDVLVDGPKNITAHFGVYEYTLATSASPAEGGTVTAGGTYTCGETTEINASANEGYEFTGWSGDATGMDNPLTVTVDGNKNIVANFKLMRYLTVNITGGGSVTIDPDNTGTHYHDGDTVTLTPVPGDGGDYAFSHWEGDATGSDDPLTVTMDADKTITAVFLLKRYLTLDTVGDGTITASPDKTGSYYLDGETVELTAAPGSCSQFDEWTGDATGTSNPVNVTMDGDKSVTANFSLKTVTLNTSVNNPAGGTVSDGGSYTCGDEAQITATPAEGWEFIGWSGDATGTANPLTLTLTADTTNVTANFQALGVRLVMAEVHDGKRVTLSATLTDSGAPLAGRRVKFYSLTAGSTSWTLRAGGDTFADGTLNRSFDLPAGNYTFRAVYSPAGAETAYSNEESCAIGAVVANQPAHGTVVYDSTPEVTWFPYTGATGYIVQVSSSKTFDPLNTVEVAAGAGDTAASLPVLPAGQKRFWRVIATLDDGCRSMPSARRAITYKALDR